MTIAMSANDVASEFTNRLAATEGERVRLAVKMISLFVDFESPGEECDVQSFAECLVNSDEGIDLMTNKFPDVYNGTCANKNMCVPKSKTQQEALSAAKDEFSDMGDTILGSA